MNQKLLDFYKQKKGGIQEECKNTTLAYLSINIKFRDYSKRLQLKYFEIKQYTLDCLIIKVKEADLCKSSRQIIHIR